MIDVQKRDDEHPKPEPEEEKPRHVHPPMIGLPIPVISAEYLQEKLRERNERLKQKEQSSAEECVPPPIPPPPKRRNHHKEEKKIELRNYDSLSVCCHPTMPTDSHPRGLTRTGTRLLELRLDLGVSPLVMTQISFNFESSIPIFCQVV